MGFCVRLLHSGSSVGLALRRSMTPSNSEPDSDPRIDPSVSEKQTHVHFVQFVHFVQISIGIFVNNHEIIFSGSQQVITENVNKINRRLRSICRICKLANVCFNITEIYFPQSANVHFLPLARFPSQLLWKSVSRDSDMRWCINFALYFT